MRRALGITFLIVLCTGARAQNPHDEGIQAGRERATDHQGLHQSGQRDVGSAPGLLQPQPAADLALRDAELERRYGGADRVLQHRRRRERRDLPGDPHGDRAPPRTPRPPVLPTDPAVITANAVASNPASQGVSLSGIYSACTTQTNADLAGALRRAELQQLLPALASTIPARKPSPCNVTWQCPAGAIAGPTRTIDASGNPLWLCTGADHAGRLHLPCRLERPGA